MEQQQKENRQMNTGSAQMLASIGETTTNNAEEKSPQVENARIFFVLCREFIYKPWVLAVHF
jgi:hypothetical protein